MPCPQNTSCKMKKIVFYLVLSANFSSLSAQQYRNQREAHTPDSLQPVYGNNPRIETLRDSICWDEILALNRLLLRNPQDESNLSRMGLIYYREFSLPHNPWKISHIDTILDRTPVVEGAADSALRYFYRALRATDSIDLTSFISMYLPIRQLEQYFGLPHNPLNQLPYDTVPGFYYPSSYFVDLPADGILDTTVDYSNFYLLNSSFFWVEAKSNDLREISEPILFDSILAPGDTVFRCAFYPSFHPMLSFRIERTAADIMLYWKKLDFTANENTWEITLHPIAGQRKMSEKEYQKFMNLLNALDFDHLCRKWEEAILDGAQWCIERRTSDSFKAHFTNMAGQKYDALYSYLIRLAGVEADYASGYYD